MSVNVNNPIGVDVSIGGNTAGALALVSTGTVTLVGGNNITLSQAGNAITLSGPSTAAATNFFLNGTSSSVSISAGAGIGIGQANSTITISANVQTVSASLTALGNTTSSSAGTFTNLLNISGAGIVSVGVGNGSVTISASTPSVTNFSTISLTALGNTTVSSTGSANNLINFSGAGAISVGVGAGSVTISGPTPVNFSTISLTALGNTTGSSTGTFNNLLNISGAGIASVGISAGSVTISVPSPAASGLLYVSASSAAGGSTAGTVTSAVIGSTLSLFAGNNVLLSQGSNAAITISVPTPAASGVLYISATSAAGGATAGTVTSAAIASTITLVAGGNITLSQGSNAAITIVGAAANAAGTQSLSAGATSVTGTGVSLALVAGPGISLATATGAGSLTVSISNLLPAKISLTQNLSLQEIGGSIASASGTVTGTAGFGSSLFLQRIVIPSAMTLSEVDLAMAMSFAATSNGGGTLSQSFVLYSFGNSSSLATVGSASGTSSWQTGTSTSGAVVSLTQFQGGWSVPKIHPMTFATTAVPAGEYVVGNLLNFAQASSTWTIQLLGALASITNSITLSNVTTTAQTLGSGLTQSVGISFTTGVQSIAAGLAINNYELSSNTFAGSAASAIATATSISTKSFSIQARTFLSAFTTSSYFFTGATSLGTGTVVSSLSLSTQSVVPQYLTVPSLVYIGTNSTTSAFPSVFIAGLMSTGAVPVAITITAAGLTYSGVQAGAQPYFALVGS